MTTTPQPKRPPKGLKISGRKLWSSILASYELEVHEELLLVQACRTADRLDELAAEAAANPITVVNARGDQIPHPAIVESRQQSLSLARLLASLRLPTGEEDDGTLKRPQRRGGARGVYDKSAGVIRLAGGGQR